ncbi:type I pullulanase [Exiguobacterium sp. SH31]|uniref:type I pullulanase n=1 Tax=unclassified Exiguobacterium TaxID=2644629 RepID=UPI0008BE7522|nr:MULTISPECIES: type I pullulanase [unclassified Exiguobacterium]OGX80098.1 type I pullulanase [Exiguobacterium sp. SH31]
MYHTPDQQATTHVTIERATLLSFETVRLEVIAEYESIPVQIEQNGRPVTYVVLEERSTEAGTIERDIRLARPVTLESVYTVFHPGHKTIVVVPREIVQTNEFERRYAYDGPLGLLFGINVIDVFVWSPVAFSIWVTVHDEDTHREIERFRMMRGSRGVWHAEVPKGYEGLLYRLHVKTPVETNDIVDPYAKAVSLNGEFGVLVDVEAEIAKHVEPVLRPPLRKATDAVIYELHIRDFTSHPASTSRLNGLYGSIVETGIRTTGDKSAGFDYLKELGVTHLQLLPVHDFGSVDELTRMPYNWGYDPIHWFALEGSYASDPSAPTTRVLEYARMVNELHKTGMRVVVDVVMNHVFIREQSSLEALVPYYYFRYEHDGTVANGTGVGNDTASERYMMRRMIVDCITYFATTYQVDGFRFDLMGIHDVETMNQVRTSLDKVDRSILIYGEGWDLATPLGPSLKASSHNAAHMPRIGHFNDMMRDALKGSSFNERERGFVSGNEWREWELRECITGAVQIPNVTVGRFPSPQYTINYVEAHDNYTTFDKLLLACEDTDETTRLRMQRLATAIVITSQGVPFLHAGQEFGRTKQGVENSYNAPDRINHFDWDLRDSRATEVEYVKTLLKLRRRHTCFRYDTRQKVVEQFKFLPSPPGVIAYELTASHSYDAWQRVRVYLNGTFEQVTFQAEGDWNVYVQGDKASLTPIVRNPSQIQVESLSMTIIAC